MGSPHKNWPTIVQLPGDYKPPGVDTLKPNYVAYQVRISYHAVFREMVEVYNLPTPLSTKMKFWSNNYVAYKVAV